MYDDGLIYRGHRIVNWDPKGQTTISDDEIVYEARKATLYTFKYSKDFPITISTTRPETKVGDVAVAVHPDDARYAGFVGKEYDATFCGVDIHIKVIADKEVDPVFGTGALGVTPAHSMTDWEIAERHNLPRPQVINEYAKMTVGDERLMGKKVLEAREMIVNWLKENNLIEKEEVIDQNVATAERTSGIIEPLPKLQWFIDVNKPIAKRDNKTLKQLMHDAIEKDGIKIIPDYFEKVYFHWIDNLRDWCISRQIWYGHRIPVWYKGEEIYTGTEAPAGDEWTQDEDTLDTWFSSGLWTFSTLGWPEQTEDLKIYHPTDVLETGYDILPFWVSRMILMTKYTLDTIPFKTVYFHGLVRDAKGQKMSKSLGNALDPLEIAAKYGADAGRMALIFGTAPGTDSKISEDKIKGQKHFANKIWNITRFVMAQPNEGEIKKELREEFDALAASITKDLDAFRLHTAAETLYNYIWTRFADEILETSKKEEGYGATLHYILEGSLTLLHPFMPFVTEKLWELTGHDRLLMVTPWPQV
jgi:valyl-tRNA synthetase